MRLPTSLFKCYVKLNMLFKTLNEKRGRKEGKGFGWAPAASLRPQTPGL